MTTTATATHHELALLLRILDEAFDRQGWHGPTLRGAIRGLSARDAAWRPGRGRHNIWEIVLHAAYWKYAVRRRLLGLKRGGFARAGSNWPAMPEPADDPAWRQDVQFLVAEHAQLREAIATFSPARLHEKAAGSRYPSSKLMYGIAAHDLYHAGQIQLLKRLHPRA